MSKPSESDPLMPKKKLSNKTPAKEILKFLTIDSIDNSTKKAAHLIRDALTNIGSIDSTWSYTPYDHDNDTIKKISMISRHILSNRNVHKSIRLVSWVLILITFIEEPEWCQDMEGGCETVLMARGVPAFGDTDETDVEYYPNFHTNILTLRQGIVIEWICVMILLAYILLMLGRNGLQLKSFITSSIGKSLFRLVLVLSTLILFVELVIKSSIGGVRYLTPYLRLLVFISFHVPVQRELYLVAKCVPAIGNLVMYLFLILLFYAWIGNTMFYGTAEGVESFPTLVEGMFTLWIMITTANYPDVMMSAFNINRIYNGYFISFMVVAYLLLYSGTILGAVMNSYTDSETEYKKDFETKITNNLKAAFDLIDKEESGEVNKIHILSIFYVLNETCPEVPYITEDEATIYFALLDSNDNNVLSEAEFNRLTTAMMINFSKVAPIPLPPVARYFPDLYNSAGYKAFAAMIESDLFDNLIDFAVLLNTMVVFGQSIPQLTGNASFAENPSNFDGKIDNAYEVVDMIFLSIFVFEVFSKLIVNGVYKYFARALNIFDFVLTLGGVIATIVVFDPTFGYQNSDIIKYIVMSRVLRLVRVFLFLPKFAVSFTTMLKLIPSLSRLFLLYLTLMYTFAVLGMQWFGGLLNRDPSSATAMLLEGTSFAGAAYWANNFNDLISGMNVLFNLIIINNWTNEDSGIEAVTGTRLSRYFFLAFHFCGVMLINNVVIASILNMYSDELAQAKNALTVVEDVKETVNTADEIESEGQAIVNLKALTNSQDILEGTFEAIVDESKLKKSLSKKSLSTLFSTHSKKLSNRPNVSIV